MHLEKITGNDLLELTRLAKKAHLESKYNNLPFSPLKTAQTFQRHMQAGELGVLARDTANDIAGFMLASVSGMCFTPRPIAMETSYYIVPEHRGGKCFLLLMTAFNVWAERQKMPQVTIPHFQTDNSKTYSALEKMGFIEAGRIYTRNMP